MNKHAGPTFVSFLEEEGIREEVDLRAKKKILAFQLAEGMKRAHVTKSALAARMKTSRSQLDRLLDPSDTSVTLATLAKASAALDLDLLISLESKPEPKPRKRR